MLTRDARTGRLLHDALGDPPIRRTLVPNAMGSGGGGGGLPGQAYVTIGSSALLSAERALAVTSGHLTLTDGGANSSVTLGLASTAVSPASYGSASSVGTFTVDQQGRLTAASSTAIVIAESAVTNLTTDLAGKVPTSRTISTTSPLAGGGALSGDLTLSLNDTAITPGTYGDASHTVAFTVDQKGRLTSATSNAILVAESQVTNLVTDLAGKLAGSTVVATTSPLAGGGTLSGGITLSLNDTAVTPASYGSATQVGTFTVDQKGRLTAAANVSIALAASAITSGQLAIAQGGTSGATALAGFNALSPLTTKGDVLTRDGTNNIRVAVGTDGFVLMADAASTGGIKWATPPGGPPSGSAGSDVTGTYPSSLLVMQAGTGSTFFDTSGNIGSGVAAGGINGIYVKRDASTGAPHVGIHGFVDTPSVQCYRANGTSASPTVMLSTDTFNEIGGQSFYGFAGTGGYYLTGAFTCVASETWASTAGVASSGGSRMNWRVTPNATVTPLIYMRLHPGGTLATVMQRIGDISGGQITSTTEATDTLEVLGTSNLTGATHKWGTSGVALTMTIGRGGVSASTGTIVNIGAGDTGAPQLYLYQHTTKVGAFVYDGTNTGLQTTGRLLIRTTTPTTVASFAATGALRLGDPNAATADMLEVNGNISLQVGTAADGTLTGSRTAGKVLNLVSNNQSKATTFTIGDLETTATVSGSLLKWSPTASLASTTINGVFADSAVVNLAPTITWTSLASGTYGAQWDYIRCAGTHTITGSDNPLANFMRSIVVEPTVQSSLNGISPWMPDVFWHGAKYKLLGNGTANAITATNSTTPYCYADYGQYYATEGANLTLSDNTAGSPAHTGQLYNGIFSVFSKPVFSSTSTGSFPVTTLTISRRYIDRWSPPTFTIDHSNVIHLKYDGLCMIEDYDALASGVTVDNVRMFWSMLAKTGANRPTNIFNLYFEGDAPSVHTGKFKIGDTTAPTQALDVLGRGVISGAGTTSGVDNILSLPALISSTTNTDNFSFLAPSGVLGWAAMGTGLVTYLYDSQVTLRGDHAGSHAMGFAGSIRSAYTISASTGVFITSGITYGMTHQPTFSVAGTGTITGIVDAGLACDMTIGAGVTAVARYGLYFNNATGAGTATTQVAVYIPTGLTKGTTNLTLKSEDASAYLSHYGPARFGDTTAPTNALEIAGTTILQAANPTLSGTQVAAKLTGSQTINSLGGTGLAGFRDERTITQHTAPNASDGLVLCHMNPTVVTDGTIASIINVFTILEQGAYKSNTATNVTLASHTTLYDIPTYGQGTSGTTTVTAHSTIETQPTIKTGDKITTRRGLYFRDKGGGGSGTMDTSIAVDISTQTTNTNALGIQSALASSTTKNWHLALTGTAPSVFGGKVLIGATVLTTAPAANLEVIGTIANQAGTLNLATNGANSDQTDPGTSVIVLTGGGSSATLTGIVAGVNGRLIFVWNNTGNQVVLKHDVTSTAANRFYIGGGDVTIADKGGFVAFYSTSASRWVVVSNFSATV